VKEITSLDSKFPDQTEGHIRSDKLAEKNSFAFKSHSIRTAVVVVVLYSSNNRQ